MREVPNISRVRRDLAELKRERRLAQQDCWLRCVGYATRPIVYVSPIGLVIWWLWSLTSAFKSLDDISAVDLLLMLGCIVGLFGAAIPLTLFFLNVDGAEINWERWGRFGLGLIAVGVSVVLWLALL